MFFTLLTFIKGFFMGAADVVPGVSGGTIAFIAGIYERLVLGISHVGPRHVFAMLRWPLLRLSNRSAASKEMLVIQEIDWKFFIPLGLGILTAILSLAKFVKGALANHPFETYSLFFGLVLYSVFFLLRSAPWRPRHYAVMFVGGVGAYFFFSGEPWLQGSEALWALFFSGAISICAMILPGISGSYILLLLGQYSRVLDAVHERNFEVLAVFCSGIAVGIFSFVRVLQYLLKKWRHETLALLTGLVIGSLRVLWPLKHLAVTPGASPESSDWAVMAGLMLLGAGVVFVLERLEHRSRIG